MITPVFLLVVAPQQEPMVPLAAVQRAQQAANVAVEERTKVIRSEAAAAFAQEVAEMQTAMRKNELAYVQQMQFNTELEN